jgi:hypothetical protein
VLLTTRDRRDAPGPRIDVPQLNLDRALFLLPALVGIGVDIRRGASWLWQVLMPRQAAGT